MATIGYARVSAADQNPDLQHDALTGAGCSRIFSEKISGALRDRPELDACLDYLREGDVLVVWKLDRLGRSLTDLVSIVAGLADREVGFRCLTQPIDTTTPTGRFVFHLFAALAQYEREMIRERAAAGRAAARERGETGGRPLAITPEKLVAARALISTGHTVKAAAAAVGVSRATLYRHLPQAQSAILAG
jgi:DNA invertase Pin-like site-specific DNA recombinase